MGIILAATASLTTFLMRQYHSLESQNSETEIVNQVRNTLGAEVVCRANFPTMTGIPIPPTEPDSTAHFAPNLNRLAFTVNGTTTVLLEKNQPVPGVSGATVKDIYVSQVLRSSPAVVTHEPGVTGYNYTAQLVIEFQRREDFVGSSVGRKVLSMQIKTQTNAAGNAPASPANPNYPSCTVGAETLTTTQLQNLINAQSQNLCNSMGGAWNGTNCALQVPWAAICAGMGTTPLTNGAGCNPVPAGPVNIQNLPPGTAIVTGVSNNVAAPACPAGTTEVGCARVSQPNPFNQPFCATRVCQKN